jgi:hypothetical protein
MMSAIDREALTRAIEIARKESRAEAKRIDERLANGDDWHDVARSCAYHCQIVALHLQPWQAPPCSADSYPPSMHLDGKHLLRRLLTAGKSRYEPSPITALERAEV